MLRNCSWARHCASSAGSRCLSSLSCKVLGIGPNADGKSNLDHLWRYYSEASLPAQVDKVVEKEKPAENSRLSEKTPKEGWSKSDESILGNIQKSSKLFSKDEHFSKVLVGKTLEELELIVAQAKQPKYRAKQLLEDLTKGATNFDSTSTLPKALRSYLTENGYTTGRSTVHEVVGSVDGTQKMLLRLHDHRVVEVVGIPFEAKNRLTVCVSSQVGCAMRCSFCATGSGGFARNLEASEIIDQVLHIRDLFKQRVTNIVFMGMGEPMLNLPEVVRAYRYFNRFLGIGGPHITISTVGVNNALPKLASYKLNCGLAVSLHAPTQELRERIVPSARSYPLETLMEDCLMYKRHLGSKLTFEYTLLSGVNDSVEEAKELAHLLSKYGLKNHVNLISWNPVEGLPFRSPSRNRVYAFQKTLVEKDISCTIRETRGLEAAAACGQLKNEYVKVPLEPLPSPAAEEHPTLKNEEDDPVASTRRSDS